MISLEWDWSCDALEQWLDSIEDAREIFFELLEGQVGKIPPRDRSRYNARMGKTLRGERCLTSKQRRRIARMRERRQKRWSKFLLEDLRINES